MQTVLTIAGFDPSSGAGVTADLMVFAAHGLFGTSAITSLTVQSTTGVHSAEMTTGRVLAETLDCLHADLPPAGIKLGMMGTSENVEVVARYLEGVRRSSDSATVVLDPVVRSSSGRELLDLTGVDLLEDRLLPLVDWVTPNLAELSLLTETRVETPTEVVSAALSLQERFPDLNILATGGHLEQPDDLLLVAGGAPHWIPGERIQSRSTHGTGCALSSSLLCRLVLGDQAPEAVARAKEYVAEAIRRAVPLGFGNGPLNHLWPLR
jgi:hydroxymethylpyrimidine/phosphomethylpyrimidine kinase